MDTINFNSEFTKVRRTLEIFALHLTKDIHNADDLFQETAMRAYRKKHLFRENTNFKSWTTTIMRNIFYTNFQKKKRDRVVLSDSGSFLENITNNTTINDGEQQMLCEDLNSKIYKLKNEFKVPFLLRKQGYNYKEIARHLDIPVGTAKSRVFFARKKIKSQLSL